MMVKPGADVESKIDTIKPLGPWPTLELEFTQVIRSKRNSFVDLVRVDAISKGRLPLSSGLAANGTGDHGSPVARRSTLVTEFLNYPDVSD